MHHDILYLSWIICSGIQFTQLCPILCDPMDSNTPGLLVHYQLPEFTQTHVLWVSDAIQPSHPLSSPSPLPSIFLSIRVFSNESVLRIRWPKYWNFSFRISLSNEHSGLISFRMDWLDLLAVWGALKSLLQHHSSKASIVQCSAFFIVQLLHPYMTMEKNIALTRWTIFSKVMSLLFNKLSRLVITFLLGSNYLLISWLQLPSAVSDFGCSCIHIPYFLYSFTYPLTSILHFYYIEKCCMNMGIKIIFSRSGFQFFWINTQKWNCWVT